MTTKSAIAFQLTCKAEWRREMARRHPQGWRNEVAANKLMELSAAAEEGNCDHGLMDRFEQMAGDNQLNGDFVSELLNSVGFTRADYTLDDLLREAVKE